MPAPAITLLTDFGTADPYVGEVKGVLASKAPGVALVDISHAVAPGQVRTAAYFLGRTWRRFPEGTVHLIVVDPGVGTERRAIAVAAHGHWFVAPDNGVLTPVLNADSIPWVLPVPPAAAPTFHGRDLFAPAAAALAVGASPASLGTPMTGAPVRLPPITSHYEGKALVGEVLHVDRFGNLITSLRSDEVPAYAVLEVEGIEVGPLRHTFGDVPRGELLAYPGSGGELEIAVRDGSAATRLGIGVGGRVVARLGG
ncbi:MAG TPA: SAM-dependent chlorinase/fluorinase [Gemmatimonadales bacterium]|nr:SAM-dependent chlorinase/fluorinase [Gemmatimonadales bacterium]